MISVNFVVSLLLFSAVTSSAAAPANSQDNGEGKKTRESKPNLKEKVSKTNSGSDSDGGSGGGSGDSSGDSSGVGSGSGLVIHPLPDIYFSGGFPLANPVFLIVGQTKTIRCKVDTIQLPTVFMAPVYTWTDRSGMILKTPRFNVDRRYFDLTLSKAQTSDSGQAYCTMTSLRSKDTFTFTHTIIVYTVPMFYMEYHIYYLLLKCDKPLISRKLADMTTFFCSDINPCSFTVTYESCVESFSAATDKLPSSELQYMMVQTVDKFQPIPVCDPVCVKSAINQLLKTVSQKRFADFSKTERDMHQNVPGLVFEESKTTSEIKMICPSGYETFRDTVCVPCMAGTYKATGAIACSPCTVFTYQPLLGSTMCVRCPHMKVSHTIGATSISQCTELMYTWYGGAMIITCFLIGGIVAMCLWRCCPWFAQKVGYLDGRHEANTIEDRPMIPHTRKSRHGWNIFRRHKSPPPSPSSPSELSEQSEDESETSAQTIDTTSLSQVTTN